MDRQNCGSLLAELKQNKDFMCFHSDFCTVIVLGQIDSEIGGTFVSRCWHSRDIPIYYVIGSRRAVGFFCVIAPQKCVGKLLANGDDMCDTVRIQIVEVNPAADGNRFSNGQTDAYSCFFRCDGVLVPRDGSCPHRAQPPTWGSSPPYKKQLRPFPPVVWTSRQIVHSDG